MALNFCNEKSIQEYCLKNGKVSIYDVSIDSLRKLCAVEKLTTKKISAIFNVSESIVMELLDRYKIIYLT